MTLYWTSGNRNDVILAIVVVIFTALELRYNLWKRINSRIGDFFGRPLPTAYVLSSPFLIWFWLSLLLFVQYDENILLVRAFNIGQAFGTGHVFVWLTIAAIVTRWGYKDILGGALVVGTYSALHELVWYTFYWLAYPSQFSGTYQFYLPFMVLGLALIGSYFLLSRNGSIATIDRRTFITFILLFVVFDLMWSFAGFPVSVSLIHGGTNLFYSLPVNLVECLSWVMPAIPLVIARPVVRSRAASP